MKKHLLMGSSIALALSLAVAGCSSKDDDDTKTTAADESIAAPTFPAGSSLEAIQKKGRITVGVKFDQNGFGLKNPTTGKVEGFDVEIADLMAQGIFGGTKAEAANKVDFVESVSKNREPFIQDGKVDIVVATYTINDTRKQVIDFAGPYYVAHGDIMVKNDNTTIKSVTDLNGKNVCAVQGSTYPATLKTKAPQATVTQFDTYALCTEALRDGRVEAVTTDNVILAGIVQANAGAFKLVNTAYTDEPYGIGLKKGDDTLRSFINDRLDTIYGNGQWKKAYEDTLGKIGLSTPEPPKVDRYTSTGSAAGTTATTAASGSSTTTAAGGASTTTTAATAATTTTAAP